MTSEVHLGNKSKENILTVEVGTGTEIRHSNQYQGKVHHLKVRIVRYPRFRSKDKEVGLGDVVVAKLGRMIGKYKSIESPDVVIEQTFGSMLKKEIKKIT